MTGRARVKVQGTVPPTRVPQVSRTGGTFAARRAERLEREAREGVPLRRSLGLRAGPGPADTNFTITDVSDDNHGSPA